MCCNANFIAVALGEIVVGKCNVLHIWAHVYFELYIKKMISIPNVF